MVSGISTTDFTTFILGDFGQKVTLNRVTKSVGNLTGDRTLSYGSDETITGVFLRRNTIHNYDREGLTENADAYFMAKTTDGISRGDKITPNTGISYRVESVIRRNPDGNTPMFDMCELFKIN